MASSTKQFRSSRGCLSYIVSDNKTKEALIIDPSEEIDIKTYTDYLKKNNLTLHFIIETHTHADHVSSAPKLKEEKGAKILQHENALSSHKDETLDEGILMLGDTKIHVLHTPGHTDDSVCIRIDDAVFTGDTLLIGGTGRTDFQNGSSKDMHSSIWSKLMTLSDNTKVYPAHNYKNQEHSTIGDEKTNNSRLLLSKKEFIRVMDDHHPPKPELFNEAVEKNTK